MPLTIVCVHFSPTYRRQGNTYQRGQEWGGLCKLPVQTALEVAAVLVVVGGVCPIPLGGAGSDTLAAMTDEVVVSTTLRLLPRCATWCR